MPEADLALLEAAARAAGEIALRHFGKPGGVREKPGGHGPVTDADLEIDRMLKAELMAARPDYGWLSEETADGPERLAAERCFVVDPIDGTRDFVAGGRAWSHALAVVERGRVVAGVVFLPRKDRLYAAGAGRGARLNGAAIRTSPAAAPEGARVLTGAAQLAPVLWPGGVPAVERHFRPSTAHRLCLVAEGRFDATLTFRDTWEWDVAAAELIVREAGGAVTDRKGRALGFNNPAPMVAGVIAAGPVLHAAMLERT